MSLRHAILVALSDEPGTGYEITKRFERGLGYFWQASHQQIYQALKRLDEDGFVAGKTVEQDSRPTKRVYRITASGRRELGGWLRTPTPRKPVRSAFLIKLFAAELADREQLVEEIRAEWEHHSATGVHYKALETVHFPDPEQLELGELGKYLTLMRGIRLEKAAEAWCEEALELLAPGTIRGAPMT